MDSRAEFRAWAETHYARPAFKISGSGDYADEIIQGAWEGWQASRHALDSCEPIAWMFQHEETGQTQCVDIQQVEWGFEANNPRLQKIGPLYTHPASVVPKGWTIEPFDEGISVLWPDKRGGVHLRSNDPKNSIAQNLLYDLAEALLCGSQPDDRPGLGPRKAAQVGKTIGVLVQREDGKVAAVTDMGRVTWLPQSVIVPTNQEQDE